MSAPHVRPQDLAVPGLDNSATTTSSATDTHPHAAEHFLANENSASSIDNREALAATSSAMAAPEVSQKKRRRPALACEQCRRRKIKCDRNMPCNHCTKAKIATCTYIATHTPASHLARGIKSKGSRAFLSSATASASDRDRDRDSRPRPVQPAPAAPKSQTHAQDQPGRPAFTPPSSQSPQSNEFLLHSNSVAGIPTFVRPSEPGSSAVPSSAASASASAAGTAEPPDVQRLAARVHHLEEKFQKVVLAGDGVDDDDADAVRWHGAGAGAAQQEFGPRGMISKTRYFGRSHWMNGFTLLPLEIDALVSNEMSKGELYHELKKCKKIGRRIKEHRMQPLSSTNLGETVPRRELADQLVDAYLRTFEGVLRVLHVPSFRAEYERYWQNPDAVADHVRIQIQLCCALGAVFHDDEFSLRANAMRWIYEAQMWLMLPPEKARMTIAGLQIMCLLAQARSVCAVGHDLVWITAGGLVRKAMYMGLHRDPSQLCDMTTFRAEMRRRLWATILELNLQTSFDAGGPPLLSANHFDTRPPANLDDDQLVDEQDKDHVVDPAQDAAVTQMTVPLALHASIKVRMRLLQHANDFKTTDSYDDTLRFNSELTKAARALTQTLNTLTKSQERAANPKVTPFHSDMAEMVMYRCFHTLHQPVIVRSLHDPKYYFSQKMYLDGALKLTSICGLSGPQSPFNSEGDSSIGSTSRPALTEFQRLVVNGSGMFRNIPIQSIYGVVLELICRWGMRTIGLGYLPSVGGYDDLRTVLANTKVWTRRRISAGETNVKGTCFLACCIAHADALEAGMDKTKLQHELLRVATEAASLCVQDLQVLAERERVPMTTPMEANEEASYRGETETPEFGDMAMESMDWMGDWNTDDTNGFQWLMNTMPIMEAGYGAPL